MGQALACPNGKANALEDVAISAPEMEILSLQAPTYRSDLPRFRGNVTALRNSAAQTHADTRAAFTARRRAVGIAGGIG